MFIVVLPIIFLIVVSTAKKIPLIGGKLTVAFLGAGILAMLLGGIYNPVRWVLPWLSGLNRVAFIIWIIVFGSIFSTLQMESGAMAAILNILRAIFGKTPQGLVLAVLIALYLGGALMGTVSAVGAVIGMLIVPALDDMGFSPELICATIVTGASMGAIMPPVSNAVNVASAIIAVDPVPVLQISYVTVGLGLIFVSIFFCKVYVGDKYRMPAHLLPKESAVTLFSRDWKKFIPVVVLIVLVMLNSLPSIKLDVPGLLLAKIPLGGSNLLKVLTPVKIIGSLTNNIVMSIICACIVSFLLNPKLRHDLLKKVGGSMHAITDSIIIQGCAAFLLGAFSAAGQMQVIAAWAGGLSVSLLKLGGAAALILAGMLLGAQSTSQLMLSPVLGPAWIATGVTPVYAAVASSHLAAAGQGLPPADLNTFVIAGLVTSILHKHVDPLKSMYLTSFYCIFLAAEGILFLYW